MRPFRNRINRIMSTTFHNCHFAFSRADGSAPDISTPGDGSRFAPRLSPAVGGGPFSTTTQTKGPTMKTNHKTNAKKRGGMTVRVAVTEREAQTMRELAKSEGVPLSRLAARLLPR